MCGVLNLNMYVIRPRDQCQNEMKKSGQGSTFHGVGVLQRLLEVCCRHGKFPFGIVTAHPYGAPSSCCNLKPRHASSARLGKYRDSSVPIVFTLPAVLF